MLVGLHGGISGNGLAGTGDIHAVLLANSLEMSPVFAQFPYFPLSPCPLITPLRGAGLKLSRGLVAATEGPDHTALRPTVSSHAYAKRNFCFGPC
jgi:hypothetical protein